MARTEDEKERALEVGRRIAQARKEVNGTGMTQRELADLLGVSERSVAAYEAGEVIPYRFMRDLENYLDRPASWILHGTEVVDRDEQLQEILTQIKALRSEVQRALAGLPLAQPLAQRDLT